MISNHRGLTSPNSNVMQLVQLAMFEENVFINHRIETPIDSLKNNISPNELIEYAYRHQPNTNVIVNVLTLIQQMCNTGSCCEQFVLVDVVALIYRIHVEHARHFDIQLLCIRILIRLVECNSTRDLILLKDTSAALISCIGFITCRNYIQSTEHAIEVVKLLANCQRSVPEDNSESIIRSHFLDSGNFSLVMYCLKLHFNEPLVAFWAIKLFSWFSLSDDDLIFLFTNKATKIILKFMRTHNRDAKVMGSSIIFLSRMTSAHQPSIDFIIKNQGVSIIIRCLQTYLSDENIQLYGMKLVHLFSLSKEGFNEISNVKGAWQFLCQDSLPEEFSTSCLPKISHIDFPSSRSPTYKNKKRVWTYVEFQRFLNDHHILNQRVRINLESKEVFFELIMTLDLLPLSSETNLDWYERIRHYEGDNELNLREIASSMIEMRKSEQKEHHTNASMLEVVAPENHKMSPKVIKSSSKPVYVLGRLINSEFLSKNDVELEDIYQEEQD